MRRPTRNKQLLRKLSRRGANTTEQANLLPEVLSITNNRAEFLLSFVLANTCVLFYNDGSTLYRSHYLSLGDTTAYIHGFSEYSFGYQRLAAVRPASRKDARLLQHCPRYAHGVVVPFSCNNIYHQSFHAIPSFESYSQSLARNASSPVFVPLVHPSAAIGRKMQSKPVFWHAWEFTLRSVTANGAEQIADETSQLLQAGCACFDRLEGNAGAFNPMAAASRSRVATFRAAALRHARVLLPPRSPALSAIPRHSEASLLPNLLFMIRHHAKRNIVNMPQLRTAMLPLKRQVREVELEKLSLAEQMVLISSATAIASVHGQALAWVLFLPFDSISAAAVEFMPHGGNDNIYKDLCSALGIRFERMRATLAGVGCESRSPTTPWLSCNITVPEEQAVQALMRALQ